MFPLGFWRNPPVARTAPVNCAPHVLEYHLRTQMSHRSSGTLIYHVRSLAINTILSSQIARPICRLPRLRTQSVNSQIARNISCTLTYYIACTCYLTDINECLMDDKACSDHCINLTPGFMCTCSNGDVGCFGKKRNKEPLQSLETVLIKWGVRPRLYSEVIWRFYFAGFGN